MNYMKINLIASLLLLCFLTSCSSASSNGNSAEEGQGKEDDTRPSEELDVPPLTWQEHWFDHRQLLKRMYYNDDLAVYYDDDVDPSIDWPNEYLTEVWQYVKNVYGTYGDDPRLYAVFHTDKYSGGHPATFMSESHDYRNVVDCGPYSWQTASPDEGLSMVIHEIGHIVEGATNGIQYNPAWNIWRDSKWAEIFIYDVYKGTGKEAFAEHTYNDFSDNVDDFPRPGTQWFKDWFYPLYSQHGESEVLNGFFDLLALHFPKTADGKAFSRRMNMGEFVHFWSGAAGAGLQPLAEDAFGWPSEWQDELTQAQIDFSDIDY